MGPSWEPIKRDLEIQEAWKLENLEVWRLGGLEARKTRGLEARRLGEGAGAANRPSWEPMDRHLEIQEAWKLEA